MSELTIQLPFSAAELDEQNYTASLLEQCAAHGLLDDSRLQQIKDAFDDAFAETAAQYTRRASSTLTRAHATQLYESVLYRADLFLLCLRDPARAVEALRTMDLSALLKKGQQLLAMLCEETGRVFHDAFSHRLNVPVLAYHHVMYAVYDNFAKRYSARFNARACDESIDYPLLGRQAYAIHLDGVRYLHAYYTSLMHENRFCRHCGEEAVTVLLKQAGRQCGTPLRQLTGNIAETVLGNLLAGALLRHDAYRLALTAAELDELRRTLADDDETALTERLQTAFAPYRALLAEDKGCYEYLCRYLPRFAVQLRQRVQNGGLQNFLVVFRG